MKQFEVSDLVKKYSHVFRIVSKNREILFTERQSQTNAQDSFAVNVVGFDESILFETKNYSECFKNFNFQPETFCHPLYFPNSKTLYIGQFDSKYKHGLGLICFSDGSFYEGQFVKDSGTGEGKVCYRNGIIWEGTVANFQPKGVGIFQFTNNDKVSGRFDVTDLIGEGQVMFHDGSFYKGNLNNFLKEGNGLLIDYNGNKYKGEFKNDVFWGEGKLTFSQNQICVKGIWENHRLIGRATVFYKDGSVYKGFLKDFQKHGNGIYHLNGIEFEGEWKEDNKEGVFKVSFVLDNFSKEILYRNDQIIESSDQSDTVKQMANKNLQKKTLLPILENKTIGKSLDKNKKSKTEEYKNSNSICKIF